jgi:hypothetical protein
VAFTVAVPVCVEVRLTVATPEPLVVALAALKVPRFVLKSTTAPLTAPPLLLWTTAVTVAAEVPFAGTLEDETLTVSEAGGDAANCNEIAKIVGLFRNVL